MFSDKSTYKGTIAYRTEMDIRLMLSYERFSSTGQSAVTESLITSLMRGMAPYISPEIKVRHLGVFRIKSDMYRSAILRN